MIDRKKLEREVTGIMHEYNARDGVFSEGVAFGMYLVLEKINKAQERAGGF